VRVWRLDPDAIRVTVEDVRSGERIEATGDAAALIERLLTATRAPDPGAAPPAMPATTG